MAPTRFRPDDPRVELRNGTARPRKIEAPAKSKPMLDVHPRTVAVLGDPSVMLLVGEGIRKGDAALSRVPPREPDRRLRLARLECPRWEAHAPGLGRHRPQRAAPGHRI